jgi:signal transduction histidine kinase
MADQLSGPSIIAERLRRSELFGELPEADLVAIAAFCHEEVCHEGGIVLVEGETADRLFVVERGKIALEKRIQLGRHSTPRNATIGYVNPGQIAGVSALTYPFEYSTSAVCVEPARGLMIDGVSLRAYLQDNPAVGLAVMSDLAALVGDRYRNATHTLTYFLSVVSHELRSPLAAIENYLQTMLGGFAGELSPKQERMLRRCVLRVTELRAQIGDVVDLARMRPEQIQADFEWFDPSEVATESIEDVRLAAVEKTVHIRIEPPPNFEPIVGARRRMRQVFTNVLNNAIRYSPEGGTVTFRAWYTPDAVCFQVDDEGPGIPPDDLPHIFKDFFRGGSAGETAGMGLGLSIAKKIVDAHEGQILVENLGSDENPAGTRFTVTIPRNLATPDMRRREWLADDSWQV